jgi:hypothetical protein
MALVTKQKKDFSLKTKDPRAHGENIIFIKGGSVIIGQKWVFFPDLQIDVQSTINKYILQTGRRLFNHFNDVLYVLLTLNGSAQVEVIPSVAYSKTSFGDIKVFPSLSGKLPLVLLKLTHDGSSDLKAFKNIQPSDLEPYQGYGNYTVMGDKGADGAKGITGLMGLTGMSGVLGYAGVTGIQGETGAPGDALRGVTGPDGPDGISLPAIVIDR